MPADDAFSGSDTGAVDHHVDTAKLLLHLCQSPLYVITVGDVGLDEESVGAQLGCQGVAGLSIEIPQGQPGPGPGEQPRCGGS